MDLSIPDTTDIAADLAGLTTKSAAITVKIATVEHYQLSGEMLVDIKGLQTRIDATFDPLIGLANDLLTKIRLTKSSFRFPLDSLRLSIERQRGEFEAAIEVAKELASSSSAELLEEMGLEPPAFTGPPALPLPRTRGVHGRLAWFAEITSKKELARAVADGVAPEEYILGNMPVLNKIAVTSKTLMKVPGVKAVNKKSTVVRRRK